MFAKKCKRFGFLSFLVLTFAALGQSRAEAQGRSWNLSINVRGSSNQISFNQGARGVWFFMESSSLTHNPSFYKFLPDFKAPCAGVREIPDVICWWDPSGVDFVPSIAINVTNRPIINGTEIFPPLKVAVHPGPDRFAMVAWRSPITGTVRAAGSFSDLNVACGNGVLWFIDRGRQTLTQGDIANGGDEDFNLPSVEVKRGQVLYFIVDPKQGDHICDSTGLDLTITKTK
jgi:hypothetical protein